MKLSEKLRGLLWVAWAFCQPGTPDLQMQCIHVRCKRPWIYDGLCMYHNYLYYRKGEE